MVVAGVGLGGMVVDGIGYTVQKATGKTPTSADDDAMKTELLE